MLEIFAVIFVIRKAISLAKQKGAKPAGWAVLSAIVYVIAALSTGLVFGFLIGLGYIDESWVEFPKTIGISIAGILVGLACAQLPLFILKRKPDVNPDIASPFPKEKDIDDSNTDILDA